MTREQFLNGTSFYIGRKRYKGAETYYYDECIMREVRSSIDERVIYKGHHANVIKVGRVGFTAFAFVMEKKVTVKYRFEDLVEFKEEA